MRSGTGRGVRFLLTAVLAVALTGCAAVRDGALDPAGPVAERQADLFLIAFVVASIVAVIVIGLGLFALFRRRHEGEGSRIGEGTWFVAIGGLILPTAILLSMMVVTFSYTAEEDQGGDFQILVTGRQFFWDVYYPEYDFTTANEIHIPTGTDVEFRLETTDVIHSFWVPELGGKADMVPGRVNTLTLHADEPGRYRGQCAEYCGLQHAKMGIIVFAHPPDEFDEWAQAQARPAVVEDARGERVFERHSCAGCHTIRGTTADGDLGPDLTHLASRETLGAGTIPNTEGHLSGWIVNSQTIKPGNEMPPIPTLGPEELQHLVDYLMELE